MFNRMTETEFIDALEKTALDLGYTVERKDYTDFKETYRFQVFHSMKLPTYKNEVLGIIKTFIDGNTECWKFTFKKEDHPDWGMCGIRFNYKYLENFKNYLIEFSKNYKQYLLRKILIKFRKTSNGTLERNRYLNDCWIFLHSI